MSQNTVILITGANRGIGLELVKLYASEPQYTVIAGVRDVTKARELEEWNEQAGKESGRGGKVHLVKIDAGDLEGNKKAAAEIEQLYGKVDVLWANAGAACGSIPVLSATNADYEDLFRTNTLGPIVLFQAFYALLQKSDNPVKKFLITSSIVGSTGSQHMVPFALSPYGASKAAVNHVAVKLAQEHGEKDGIAVVCLHPGSVMSDLGRQGWVDMGLDPDGPLPMPVATPEECANSLKAVVDGVTVEKDGGKFIAYDGSVVPW